ncbi:hypothetical protein C8D87_114105 [Lentzea atacamensis]|uniref:Excreted virulence factor EspC, type VII ESX diderm n=1 Tax=Lentzea atacamensis TaxID=531938 RepID=A0ABX9DY62_9PSEU|nr:hypothetical protein [Lentzea atacamensis]RAS59493.1 hypothetical protein C8D87_114105 [Lentzea atacamensis]
MSPPAQISDDVSTATATSVLSRSGLPNIVIRLKAQSGIYAKVAGDLDSVLDTAAEQPAEWLAAVARELHARYVTAMQECADEADRLLALHRDRQAGSAREAPPSAARPGNSARHSPCP